jgi:hypothetical protein
MRYSSLFRFPTSERREIMPRLHNDDSFSAIGWQGSDFWRRRGLGTPRRRATSDIRQAAMNLFNQVLNGDMPPKFAAFLVFVLFDPKMLA